MSKKIKATLKLQIQAASATPAPPVGSSLGQHGVNIMDFCKKFNAATASRKGETVPVLINIYTDKTFDFTLKTPPVTELLKKRANIKSGAKNPGKEQCGTIKIKDIEEIAKVKMPDLNACDIEAAKKIIAGSARSMGLLVVD
ncbi:MAG: 50S ribosomal protein L11 [candidate division TM6 bacterium GW2011_GWF2_38_10]|nr:MAG: 50S ribosomal protein L11 [candidate division TM6 bacterium GW2011_GWF2_38_10]